MDQHQRETVDITPDQKSFAYMKVRFTESIANYQQDLRLLERLRGLTWGHWSDIPQERVRMCTLLEEMLDAKMATIEDSIQTLQEGIAELERCG